MILFVLDIDTAVATTDLRRNNHRQLMNLKPAIEAIDAESEGLGIELDENDQPLKKKHYIRFLYVPTLCGLLQSNAYYYKGKSVALFSMRKDYDPESFQLTLRRLCQQSNRLHFKELFSDSIFNPGFIYSQNHIASMDQRKNQMHAMSKFDAIDYVIKHHISTQRIHRDSIQEIWIATPATPEMVMLQSSSSIPIKIIDPGTAEYPEYLALANLFEVASDKEHIYEKVGERSDDTGSPEEISWL